MSLVIVGCGFLGSIAAEEIAKRQFALQDTTPMQLLDCDTVADRNTANQNFTLRDVDFPKAEVLAKRVSAYNVSALGSMVRIDAKNIHEWLAEATLVLDAVDNLATRQLLWGWSKGTGVPVIHAGVSQLGLGRVDWTYDKYDSWPLSPIALLGRKHAAAQTPTELKPCELIAFRGLGVNMGIAVARAVGIWRGYDPEGDGVRCALPRVITTWEATNYNYTRTHTCEDYT